MSTCRTSVKTPTGVFTFHDKRVNYGQAKIECLTRGEILAPLTNADDVNALRSIIDINNKDCEFHYGFNDYQIGLDITICGGVQTRIFTNNVIWNETEHGQLYEWVGSETKDINVARFSTYITDKLFIIEDSKRSDLERFICLKPSSKAPSCPASLFAENSLQSYSLSFLCGAFMLAVVGSIFILSVKKKRMIERNELVTLRNEIKVLKEENETYKLYSTTD